MVHYIVKLAAKNYFTALPCVHVTCTSSEAECPPIELNFILYEVIWIGGGLDHLFLLRASAKIFTEKNKM